MLSTISLRSSRRQELINVTEQVQSIVVQSNVASGLCVVYCPHSTAGLVVNSYLDPLTPADIVHELDRLIPTRLDFQHTFDTPSDAAAHVKAVLVGTSQTLIVHEAALLLGFSQGILFAELDGPRDRKLHVKLMPDSTTG